jgi:hypothetical protein
MRRIKQKLSQTHTEVNAMQLIQIGTPQSKANVSVREMFEQLAQREAEMVRAARERIRLGSSSTSVSGR